MPFITPYEISIPVANGITTDWQLLPVRQPDDYMDNLVFGVGPDGAGTVRIEITYDTIANVKLEILNPGSIDSIMPLAWPDGDVSVITQNNVVPPTAWRAVNTSGDVFVTVRGI